MVATTTSMIETTIRVATVIRCKRIYNFWYSMLVLHQLLYVLFTLCGIFMHFLELLLTRCHSASSYFLLFLYFKKVI
jgi:hypothetical protein